MKRLSALNKFDVAGLDGLNPAIVRLLVKLLTVSIKKIHDACFREVKAPKECKAAIALRTCIYMSRQKQRNHEPVSLTCVLSKCLEKIIRNQVCEHLVNRDAIASTKH